MEARDPKDLKVTLGFTEFKKGQPELLETLFKDDHEFLISPASTWHVYLMRLLIFTRHSVYAFTRHSVYALLGTEPRTSFMFSSALLALILSLQVLHGKLKAPVGTGG